MTQQEYWHLQVLNLVGGFHSCLFSKYVAWEFMLFKKVHPFSVSGNKPGILNAAS